MAGYGFGIFVFCHQKIDHRQTTSFFELTQQREPPFHFFNILFNDFVLLRKVEFCRAQIKRGALLRQIYLARSSRINLIQTNSGFLRKLFITDACAFKTTKHSHCLVLYFHSSSSISTSANISATVFILRFFLFILTLIIFCCRACCICYSMAAQIRSLSRRFSSSSSR